MGAGARRCILTQVGCISDNRPALSPDFGT